MQRLKPRHNPDVNSYWMCDYGRYRYEWMNRGVNALPRAKNSNAEVAEGSRGGSTPGGPGSGTRLEVPLVRDGSGLRTANWKEAVTALVDRLKAVSGGVTVVGSPYHANEDTGLLRRLQQVLGGGNAVYRSPRAEDEVTLPGFAKLTRRRDLSANGRGLDVFGFQRVGDDAGTGGLSSPTGALIVLGDALSDLPEGFADGAELVVYLGTVGSPALAGADFVLPVTSYAEQEGTFTNFEGRVQRFWPALNPPPMARPAWQVLGVVLAGLEDGVAPATAGDAFLRIAQLYEPLTGLRYPQIGTRGALLNEPVRLAAGEGV